MVVGLRSLRNDNFAFTGGMLVLIPLVISIILSVVFIPLDVPSDLNSPVTLGDMFINVPVNYDNMTVSQREAYLADTYGGNYTEEFRFDLGFRLSVGSNPFGVYWYVFPDGTEFTVDQYRRFIFGDATEVDYLSVVYSIATVDPPALKHLGVYGEFIRIVMIVSVAIGLTEILWIG